MANRIKKFTKGSIWICLGSEFEVLGQHGLKVEVFDWEVGESAVIPYNRFLKYFKEKEA